MSHRYSRTDFDLSLYLIADVDGAGDRDLVAITRAALAGGATLVQLRAKSLPGGAMVELARALLVETRAAGRRLIVNDRVDVCLAAGADGAHVGQDDIAPADARLMLGPDRILGLTASSPAEMLRFDPALVDYVGIGPAYPTTSKDTPKPVLGPDGVGRLARTLPCPAVGIGGIGPGRAAAVITAGARGVAVIGALCAAADPAAVARQLIREITEARP